MEDDKQIRDLTDSELIEQILEGMTLKQSLIKLLEDATDRALRKQFRMILDKIIRVTTIETALAYELDRRGLEEDEVEMLVLKIQDKEEDTEVIN